MTSRSQLFEALLFYRQSRRKRNLVVIHGRVESGMLVRLTSVHGELDIRKGAGPQSQALARGQVTDTMDK